jgi:DnaK suppressor protein
MAVALNGSDGESDEIAYPGDHDGRDGYRPHDDEPFMNPTQQGYFRAKLQNWKESIIRESAGTLTTLQNESLREPDVTDRASSETDWSLELRTRDRQRKLIAKIDAALRRLEEGEYGYCEVTGEPISLGRLEARPIATMTVEAQERHERQEKISRDE